MHDTVRRRPSRRGLPASRTRRLTTLATLVAAGIAGLATPAPAGSPPSDLTAMKAGYQRPGSVPFPPGNAYTPAKAELGHKLFFDPRLSGPSTMSCATCHNPALAWGDGLPTGVGSAANRLGRRSPTILNLAWADALFWDGRAGSLEEQAVGPIQAPGEMNQAMPRLVASLGTIPGYRAAFEAVFPGEPISATTIAKAIATFERTVVSGQAPFDRWIAGDEAAISEPAKRGFLVFNTGGNCAACHSSWRLTDDSFHDIGLPGADLGRGKLVEGVEPLRHAFKTPGSRNVAERAPYMHDGSLPSLTAVIRHYDHGFVQRPSLSEEIHPLGLTPAETADLVAFLRSLSSTDASVTIPVLPTTESD